MRQDIYPVQHKNLRVSNLVYGLILRLGKLEHSTRRNSSAKENAVRLHTFDSELCKMVGIIEGSNQGLCFSHRAIICAR